MCFRSVKRKSVSYHHCSAFVDFSQLILEADCPPTVAQTGAAWCESHTHTYVAINWILFAVSLSCLVEFVRQSVKSINSRSYDVLYGAGFNRMFNSVHIGGVGVLKMSTKPGPFILLHALCAQSQVHCSFSLSSMTLMGQKQGLNSFICICVLCLF